MSLSTFKGDTLERSLVSICGSFAPNNTSNPVAADNRGSGFTVVRSSAGLFLITFETAYPDYRGFTASLQLPSAGAGQDQFVQVGQYDATAKTLQIRVYDISGTAVADVGPDANTRISFMAQFYTSV